MSVPSQTPLLTPSTNEPPAMADDAPCPSVCTKRTSISKCDDDKNNTCAFSPLNDTSPSTECKIDSGVDDAADKRSDKKNCSLSKLKDCECSDDGSSKSGCHKKAKECEKKKKKEKKKQTGEWLEQVKSEYDKKKSELEDKFKSDKEKASHWSKHCEDPEKGRDCI